MSDPESAVLDVVFLHGLDGDARETWAERTPSSFWPMWLADDFDAVAVWSVSYEAWSSGWRGRAMPMQDRAINLMAQLQNRGIGRRPLCFVTHSMGGLLAKEILLHAAEGRTDYAAFASAARGVVFLGTPHSGAGLSRAVEALGVVYRATAAVKDLKRNAAHLRHLNDRYRDWATESRIRNLVFFEAYPTKGVRVVDEASANPGLPGVRPIPVDANHIDICKPINRDSLVYGQVKQFIIGVLGTTDVAEPGVRVGVVPLLADRFQARGIVLDLDQPVAAGSSTLTQKTTKLPAVRTVVLVGTGGVGKTQLAADFATRSWHDQRLRLAVWVTAASRISIITAYAEAARRLLGADSTDLSEAAQRLLEWMGSTDERWLVVLDDLRRPSDLRDLWPTTGRAGQVVVTTRRRDPALHRADRAVLPVDVFTSTESLSYLRAKLTATGTGLALDEGAADLADTLGHLPLALAQAAAYQLDRGLTCHRYRERFLDHSRTLAEIMPDPDEDELPDGYRHTIATTWSLSIDLADRLAPRGLATPLLHIAAQLDPAGTPQTVFTTNRLLNHLADTTGHNVTEDTVTDALAVLHRLSLLTLDHTQPARVMVTTHALVQRAVRDTLNPERLRHHARIAADALLACDPAHPQTVLSLARLLGAELKDLLNGRSTKSRDSLVLAELPEHIDPDAISLGREHAERLGEVLLAAIKLQETSVQEHGPDHPRTMAATLALGHALAAADQFDGQQEAALVLVDDACEGLSEAYEAGTAPPEVLGLAESIRQWVLDLPDETLSNNPDVE